MVSGQGQASLGVFGLGEGNGRGRGGGLLERLEGRVRGPALGWRRDGVRVRGWEWPEGERRLPSAVPEMKSAAFTWASSAEIEIRHKRSHLTQETVQEAVRPQNRHVSTKCGDRTFLCCVLITVTRVTSA